MLRTSCERSYWLCRREARLRAPASRTASLTGGALPSSHFARRATTSIRERALLGALRDIPVHTCGPLFQTGVV